MYHPDVFHIPRDEEEGASSPTTTIILTLVTAVAVPGLIAYFIGTGREIRTAAVVLGVLGGLALFARPFWGLMLLTGLIYVRPEDQFPDLAGMRLTFWVSLATIVATYLHLVLDKQRPVRTAANAYLAGFALVAFVSTLRFGNDEQALEDISKLIILVLLIVNLVRTPERFGQFLSFLLVCTTYIAGYAVSQFYGGGALNEHGTLRAKGTGVFGDPNDLSASIDAGLAIAAFRAYGSRGPSRAGYLALSIFYLIAVFLTGSRGGMIALIAVTGLGVICVVRLKLLAIGLAFATGLAFLTFGPQRMTTFDAKDESAYNRFVYWDNGWKALLDEPFIGVGYGMFLDRNGGATAHNSFILCAAELGLIGYFLWMGVIVSCFRMWRTIRSREGEDPFKTDATGAMLGLLGYLVAVFWISRTYSMALYVLVGAALAGQLIAAAREPGGRSSTWEHLRSLATVGATTACTLLLVRAITIYYL